MKILSGSLVLFLLISSTDQLFAADRKRQCVHADASQRSPQEEVLGRGVTSAAIEASTARRVLKNLLPASDGRNELLILMGSITFDRAFSAQRRQISRDAAAQHNTSMRVMKDLPEFRDYLLAESVERFIATCPESIMMVLPEFTFQQFFDDFKDIASGGFEAQAHSEIMPNVWDKDLVRAFFTYPDYRVTDLLTNFFMTTPKMLDLLIVLLRAEPLRFADAEIFDLLAQQQEGASVVTIFNARSTNRFNTFQCDIKSKLGISDEMLQDALRSDLDLEDAVA